MAKVRVITDSGSDLPKSKVDELSIVVVSLSVRFGSDEFVDTVTLSPREFWEKCKNSPQSSLPETAAPSPGSFQEAFLKSKEDGYDGIVCVTLSSGVSSTFQSALQAKELVKDEISVEVVDSQFVSIGQGLIAVGAAEAARDGKDVSEVAQLANELIGRTVLMGTLDTLEYLKRGGRIGSGAALVGSLLSIKPIVEVRDGKVAGESKHRTRGKSLDYVAEKAAIPDEVERFALLNGEAQDFEVFKNKVLAIKDRQNIIYADIGPIIGTHVGQGAVGFAYQTVKK